MVFNSFEFLAFFALVAPLYWLLPLKAQHLMLLLASYVFYMAWRADYAILLVVSTLIDYGVGLVLGRPGLSPARRRATLTLSIVASLTLLCTFKYWAFFGQAAEAVSNLLGWGLRWPALDVLLPVGISFYTFQTMSYTIDVYRGLMKPERSLVRFALFISFFPQLVAGPIERATHLIPQFWSRRVFVPEQLALGLKLMAIGFFKKMAVGDNLAPVVDAAYAAGARGDPVQLLLGTYAFAFQIYADFSGYSDIAVGTALVLGFDIMANFATPYFAASPAEFWRRWHISLSTWLRDYLYIPLGGSRRGAGATYANLMVTMLLGGLWHGANWTFVAWGALNGLYLVVGRALGSRPWTATAAKRLTHPAARALGAFVTFHLICVTWVFFRAPSIDVGAGIAGSIGRALFSGALLGGEALSRAGSLIAESSVAWTLTAALIALDAWIGTGKSPERYRWLPSPLRGLAYASLVLATMVYGVYNASAFIYFQF